MTYHDGNFALQRFEEDDLWELEIPVNMISTMAKLNTSKETEVDPMEVVVDSLAITIEDGEVIVGYKVEIP